MLVGVADFQAAALNAPTYGLHKICFDFVLDDDDYRFKTGAAGVKQRIIQYGFSVAADRINLLQAAIPTAHAGSHHHKNWFFHNLSPLNLAYSKKLPAIFDFELHTVYGGMEEDASYRI